LSSFWTAVTVEDYMRCQVRLTANHQLHKISIFPLESKDSVAISPSIFQVINFPIGVHNGKCTKRHDHFNTWLLSQCTVEAGKKHLFVCQYDAVTKEVRYVKPLSMSVVTKAETLGNHENINLGAVTVDEEFFDRVYSAAGVPLWQYSSSRVFLRRVFPVQAEDSSRGPMRPLVVTEAIEGQKLTHVDNGHVLVVQEGGQARGTDYNKWILAQVRKVIVRFKPQPEVDEEGVDQTLEVFDRLIEPQLSVTSVLAAALRV
jgi:hypothetical protein